MKAEIIPKFLSMAFKALHPGQPNFQPSWTKSFALADLVSLLPEECIICNSPSGLVLPPYSERSPFSLLFVHPEKHIQV